MIIIAIAAFLAGLAMGLGYAKIRCKDLEAELDATRNLADFWHEHCANWHQLAVAAGAGQRKPQKPVPAKAEKVQRINVPRPPQAEIVAAGRTGIHVWRN